MASLLHRAFPTLDVQVMSEANLEGTVEGELCALRPQMGKTAFPVLECLRDWDLADKGWRCKFYKSSSKASQM